MTKRIIISKALGAALTGILLLFACKPASAQRTISGQPALAFSAHYSGTSVGAEAFFQQYTLGGFWEAGASFLPFIQPLSSGGNLYTCHIAATGGYIWRLAATRSRSCNWYAGAGAFTGIEWLDPFHRLPDYLDLGVSEIRFLYGVYTKTVLELFLSPRFAVLVQGAVPVNFSSVTGYIHWQAGLGLKFMLN